MTRPTRLTWQDLRDNTSLVLKGLVAIPLVLLYLVLAVGGVVLYAASHQVRYVLEWLGVEVY